MEAIWVFKIIYPLIFSLVPLALFHIFREQIGAKRAFFAAFFFMAAMTFFTDMTALARQQVAELFFALLIMLLVDRKLALNQRTTLAIIFVISLVMSHYALGYICLAFLLIGWAVVALIRSRGGRRAWRWLTREPGDLPENLTSKGAFPHKIMAVIICVYLVMTLCWYGGIAQGRVLDIITHIGHSQQSLLATEFSQPGSTFFEPTEREALVGTAVGLDFAAASPLGKGFRIFQYLTQLFIVVGFIMMILKPKGFKFKPEYIGLSVAAALILLACIVVPRFSSHLNVSRFYHISLLVLAPFCILGGEAIWQGASRLFKTASSRLKLGRGLALQTDTVTNSTPLRFVALAVLIPYFLFCSGFIYEVSGHTPGLSIPLSSYRTDLPVFNQKEAAAVAYLSARIDENTLVYADEYGRLLLSDQLYGQIGIIQTSEEVPEDAYIFLRTWNVEREELNVIVRTGVQRRHEHVKLSDVPTLFEKRKVIYDNGSAQILAPI